MKRLTILILAIGFCLPAQARPGKKKAKIKEKLNAYVELLNLTGPSLQSGTENYSTWKGRGYLGEDCATKHVRWPIGLTTQFVRMGPGFKSAFKLKGKTKVDALVRAWAVTTAPLQEADNKAAAHFKEGLHKKDNCVEGKKLATNFEKSFSEYMRARGEVSAFFKKKEMTEMFASVKKIKKKHGDGFWYAQAHLLLQEKRLITVVERVLAKDPKALAELAEGYRVFSMDLEKLNKKIEKQKVAISVRTSYVDWAKYTNSFSDSLEAFMKTQDLKTFSQLKKWEKAKLENKGKFKVLIQAYNHGIDASNRIRYSKDFH